MQIKSINSLVELFFVQYEKQDKNKICLLTEYLKESLSNGDRCVLLSENRPEWLIADIAIMNAGGVTVPLFTTYSEKDYEYIINDCKKISFLSFC